jgi:hypothetical protein
MPDEGFRSMPPEAKRSLRRFGPPVVVAALLGMAIGAYGDRTESSLLIAIGVGIFMVAFLVWAVVVTRLLAKPHVKAWTRAMERGPSANRFNSVVCSVLVAIGVIQISQEPSGFSVVFLLGSVGMLVLFIYRGWFSKPSPDD